MIDKSFEYLRKSPSSPISPPINTTSSDLPIGDLSWEDFEKLCLRLVEEDYSIYDCEIAGIKGQKQDGIDIFAQQKNEKYSTYQCKRYEKIYQKSLDKIVNEFRKGKWYSKSERFYICTSLSLASTTLQDKFNELRDDLRKDDIELVKWDYDILCRLLKDKPRIVYDFFDEDWVKRFNGEQVMFELEKQLVNIPFPENEDKVALSDTKLSQLFKTASSELYSVKTNFTNIPSSHIQRKETEDLYNWVQNELKGEESNISVLVGGAGVGKTVILKDLLDRLNDKSIPVLGLKSDRKILDETQYGKSIFERDESILALFEHLASRYKTVVVLIDQIDALSQSLSTNRSQIKAYTSLISRLSSILGLRIIISCRAFDLNNNSDFDQFINKKQFTVGLLSKPDVTKVLKELLPKEQNLPDTFVELLRTPLHLDVFCKSYSNSIVISEIKSIQDLYLNLWNKKIYEDCEKRGVKPRKLSKLLYKIADQIFERQENLSVPNTCFLEYNKELRYLKSEALIIETGSCIQFFHQSFYDFTYAKNFVEKKGGDLCDFLLGVKHQGLFLRSLVKQVLSYLRGTYFKQYIQEIERIVLAPEIRYHIKLLVVQQLATEEQVKQAEFSFVSSLLTNDNDKELASAFFSSACNNKQWLWLLEKKSDHILGYINGKDKNFSKITLRFTVFQSKHNSLLALKIIDKIDNEEIKFGNFTWAFHHIRDFSPPLFSKMYTECKAKYKNCMKSLLHANKQLLETNSALAISELKELFDDVLPEIKDHNKHDRDLDLFVGTCESLCKSNPQKAYTLIKQFVFDLINVSKDIKPWSSYNRLHINSAFDEYDSSENDHHKFIDCVVSSFERLQNEDYKRNELIDYLNSSDVAQHLIALQIINNDIKKYVEVTWDFLTNNKLVEDYLEIKDLCYYYREILHSLYQVVSIEKKDAFDHFVLSFYPEGEAVADRDYLKKRRNRYQYSKPLLHWGYSQCKLLCSIPSEHLRTNPSLLYASKTFQRRYEGWDICSNKEPNYTVGLAHACGGLTSPARYEKLSFSNWLDSFKTYKKEDHWYSRTYFSIDSHANSFRDVVKENSKAYYPFVLRIFDDKDVIDRYRISAVEGLIQGEYDVALVLDLYKNLLSRSFEEGLNYSLIRMSEYFFSKSIVDYEIVIFIKAFIESPAEICNSSDDENELFNSGHNTINARAISAYLILLRGNKHKSSVYEYLLELEPRLPLELKLVVIYYVNDGSNLEGDQLLNLFLAYTREPSFEFYSVATRMLSFLIFKYFNKLKPFLLATLNDEKSAKALGAYLLFAWYYGYEESKKLLFDLHEMYPQSIVETIKQACENLSDEKYSEKSLFILDYYKEDTREVVLKGFDQGMYKLKSDDFLKLSEIIKLYLKNTNRKNLHSFFDFLSDSAGKYPEASIKLLSTIDLRGKLDEEYYLTDAFRVLVFAYNSICQYDSASEEAEFALGVFDNLLRESNGTSDIDRVLKELSE